MRSARARVAGRWLAVVAALAATALGAGLAVAAPEGPAPPDSGLGGFLDSLSTTTDSYFGMAAAPADTTGLDSALAHGLARPSGARPRARLRPSLAPEFSFNRAEGPTWGGSVGLPALPGVGRISFEAGYAAGPNAWRGGGRIEQSFRARGSGGSWRLGIGAGRAAYAMDRDHWDLRLSSLRALVSGGDRTSYLLRDGFAGTLARESETWRAEAAFRDQLEKPLATTTTWNLAHTEPTLVANLPARRGRVHEVGFTGTTRLLRLPVWAELSHQTSGGRIGSAFEYRRTRAALAGDLSIAGPMLSLVPQLSYGRLVGDEVPQAAFFLGGSHSLRSLPGAARAGTGLALARLELVESPDLLEVLRIPHSQAFPIQVGGFAAAGAVWGRDPVNGLTRRGDGWPRAEDWLREAGFSVLYRPGLPDPWGFLRVDCAWALGERPGRPRLSAAYTRALDLLSIPGR